GPAIKPVVLKLVREVSQGIHVPIIASGGASTYRDVIQFLLAGATAVEIGSESLRNPLCFLEIIQGIEEYMERFMLHSIGEITGTLEIV
ncbi:MAG: HisA/HisF-related TIM barrel protein, partial [Desulfomonilia bacterium]|nr:HisA/HisF-related TIM barrel protein [Desulfomonilia bacterium]